MIVLLFLFAVAVTPAFGQSNRIRGCIVDATTQQPVPHAVVRLRESDTTAFSDNVGQFQFERIRPGRCTLSVHHLAYTDKDQIVDASSPDAENVRVNLQPTMLRAADMIVQSTRTSSSLHSTPYPVSVESGEGIIRNGGVTVSDALMHLPGVTLVRDGSWETAVSIRGMGRSDIVALIDQTRIETANDIAGSLSLVNANDLERVEIVRSSASTLYGTGAFGGIVHFVSKRPAFADTPDFRSECTNGWTGVNGGRSHFLSIDGSAKQAAFRVSGGYRRGGDTRTPDGVLGNSRFSDFTLSGSVAWKPAGEGTLLLSYQRAQAEDAGIPGGAPFSASASARYTLARRELFAAEYQLPGISPVIPLATARLTHQAIDRNVEIIQTPSLILTPHAAHRTSSGQIECRIAPASGHTTLAGIEVWERSLDSRRERRDLSAGKVTGERPVPVSRYISAGVYIHHSWDIIPEHWNTTWGIRYDAIRVRNDAALNPEYVVLAGLLQTSPAEQKVLWNEGQATDESWSAHAGTRLVLIDWLDATFLLSSSFRSPSLEERFQFLDLGSVVRLGDPRLRSERSIGANAGLRARAAAGWIQSDFFINELSDRVSELPGVYEGRNAFIKHNIGKARLYGYECSGAMMLTPWATAGASISYVRGENTRDRANLPQIPPLTGTMEVTGFAAGIGTLRLSALVAADHNSRASGEPFIAGFGIAAVEAVSVPMHVGPCILFFRGGIQNIFDRSYRTSLSTLRGTVLTEPGRNVFLNLTVNL